jgi:hypothetical protein
MMSRAMHGLLTKRPAVGRLQGPDGVRRVRGPEWPAHHRRDTGERAHRHIALRACPNSEARPDRQVLCNALMSESALSL